MRTVEFVVRTPADLGRTVAEARFERGVSQQELADRVGIERTYLSRVESGHAVRQVERLLLLLRALGVSLTASMVVDDDEPQDPDDPGVPGAPRDG